MPSTRPVFGARSHRTALSGWRVPFSRRPALSDCSLVVPVSDEHEIAPLLDTLLAVSDAPGEVVIVDAGPRRTASARLRDWGGRSPAPFILVYVASPPGLTRQRNIGIDVSTRDFIFFLDPGLEPLPGFFAAARRVFDVDRERCVGGVAGVILEGARGRGARDSLRYPRSGSCRLDAPAFVGLRRVDVLPGCASAWRREVFATRRFSCFFRDWPEGEDVDFSLRAGREWTLLACGEARVKRVVSSVGRFGYDAGLASVRNRRFVWRRRFPNPEVREELRFWSRAALDWVAFIRPWSPARLAHAAGMIAGMVSCLKDPPRFTEPPARREYFLRSEERVARTGN